MMNWKMVNTKTMLAGRCLLAAGLLSSVMTLPGCTESGGEAQKLTAEEGIDWEAIEAEGAEIAEGQKEGE